MVLGIYGAGGLGREVLELVKQLEKISKRWSDIIFVVDSENPIDENQQINGKQMLDFESAIQKYSYEEMHFVIAVGEPGSRKKLFDKVKKKGYFCETLIHPNVYIPENTKLSEGVVVQTGAVISCNVDISENVFIQNAACVGHDSQIGAHSVLSANVAIAGHCIIGKEVYIGLNVPIKEEIIIGNNTIIGMGAVVVRDIPENVIAMGNPARPLKNKNESTVFKN